MICPDINLLLYATFATYPEHARAKAWWDGVLSSSQQVRLGHVVVLGFIRISTNRRVFAIPLTTAQAIDVADGWLQQPNVELIPPANAHWVNLKTMLVEANAGSNLTTDAHIAALAADYGLVVHSNDTDFARFPNIKVSNPLRVS
ncbi:MAG: PIN domain-containing protein [Planctomycetota bacterium]|nr:PIN domain-containing protein [Planctomycetota bacterium]